MRYLKNLSSTETFEGNPWEFIKLDLVPPNCLGDKAARETWANLPATDFMFYTGFVAINENARVSEAGGKDSANSPRELRCFVGDYDAKFTEQEVESAIARMDIKPNWVERSLSGNWRLVWIFEVPILLSSRNFAVFLLKSIHDFLPIKELSNLDSGYTEPSRYYANGCQWRQVNPNPIPHALVVGWLVKLCRSYSWKDMEPGVVIPIPVVAERLRELKDKYPRFQEWKGDFALGAQGPTFWVDGSTSERSAIVMDNGMKTFSNHANQLGKGWWSWSELLGADWVKQFEQNRIGTAVKDVYFDGKDYAVKRESGRWDILNKDNVQTELVVMRGLSREVSKKKGERFSEVEAAYAYIHNEQRVKAHASFAFSEPKGKIFFNGHYYLNTHTRDVIQPAEGKAIWGPEGQFPFLSDLYDNFFATPDQLPFFLSWASKAYKGCYNRNLTPGHALYIGGPVGCGKTFQSREVMGRLLGGFAEAKAHLLGETNFNSQLFDYAYHAVDDTSMETNSPVWRKFCEKVKQSVANPSKECNEKFRIGAVIGNCALTVITCNMDSTSFTPPDMDAEMADKVMMFLAKERTKSFPGWGEVKTILDRELPWFGRFLLDYEIPEQCRSSAVRDERFGGIKPYHDPYMVISAQQSSRASNTAELMNAFMREYFTKTNPDANVWTGSALDLWQQFAQVPGLTEVLRKFDLDRIKRDLMTLSKSSQFKIRILEGSKIRTYEIDRCTHYPKNLTVLEVPEQRTDSIYQKSNDTQQQ
jgi:hypothetical protein